MKICMIGTHCSGKTTLIDKLYSKIEFEGYSFFQEPVRMVGRAGFHVNQNSDDASQLAMLAIHLQNLKTENFIADRSLLDLYVYGLTLKNLSKTSLDFIHDMLIKHINEYDYLFHCQPEFKLVDDGFRSSNKEWQMEIKNLFDKEIEHLLECGILKNCKIINLTGSTEERSNKVLQEVIKC